MNLPGHNTCCAIHPLRPTLTWPPGGTRCCYQWSSLLMKVTFIWQQPKLHLRSRCCESVKKEKPERFCSLRWLVHDLMSRWVAVFLLFAFSTTFFLMFCFRDGLRLSRPIPRSLGQATCRSWSRASWLAALFRLLSPIGSFPALKRIVGDALSASAWRANCRCTFFLIFIFYVAFCVSKRTVALE